MAEDELTPEQSMRVRRLLAEARHTEPMPEEVATRLDGVLQDLGDPGLAHPVPLATRRRRAGRLLLAAAAVVVVGVGIGQVLGGAQQAGDEATSATDSAESGSGGQAAELEAPDRDGAAEDRGSFRNSPGTGAVVESQRSLADVARQRIRADRFASDAQRARTTAAARDTVEDGSPGADGPVQNEFNVPASAGCRPGAWGGGRYVPVHYGATPGWLVIRAPLGKTQVADLFLCGEDVAERSTTLPFE